jgi:hypothetical protein
MDHDRFQYDESSSTTMGTNPPRSFSAATDILAFMQAFTTESVRQSSRTVQPRRSGSRGLRSFVRSHRAARTPWA